MGLTLVADRKKATYDDYELVEKVALDTSQQLHLTIILAIEKGSTTTEIVDKTGLEWNIINAKLNDLKILKVVAPSGSRKSTGKSNRGLNAKIWRISQNFSNLLQKARIGQKPVKVRRRKKMRLQVP